MKKILTLLVIGIVSLTSCTEELVHYSISIGTSELSFSSAGGEDTVKVTSTEDWELSGNSYWCYASEYYGNGDSEIIFTADPNEDSESNRSATFTFISGDKRTTLTVTQEKKEYSISIEPKELQFGIDGGEQEITVTSSDDWEVKGESDWCDISSTSGKNGDKVTFSADPYTNTEEARTATYTFICGDKEVKLTIEQEAKVYSISVEPTELSFIAAGEEKSVTVNSSDEWEFSSDEYWITALEQSGDNGATVKIKVEENEDAEIRTGTVTFRCGDKQADVKITQEAKEFSISIEPTKIEFGAEGGVQEITVNSSDSWRLSTDNWIKTSAKTGSNGDIVKIIVDYNASTEVQTGIITFTCGNKTAEFTVTQNPDDSPIIQFKDPLFLQAILRDGTDYNGDGQISILEASLKTRLNCYFYGIRVMDEIKYFTALTYLDCDNNQLTSLDLSNNTALTTLYCYDNQLTSLDVSNNTALTTLYCFDNQLTSLDVSNNTALTALQCYNNQLTALDVSNNTALTHLTCRNNQLTALDLSNNTALTSLTCFENQLTSLDVSNSTALESLNCYDNQLTSLDVSNHTALTYLNCDNNQLTSLDVSNSTALESLYCDNNQLTALDLSNNTALEYLSCYENPLQKLIIYTYHIIRYFYSIEGSYGDIIEYAE